GLGDDVGVESRHDNPISYARTSLPWPALPGIGHRFEHGGSGRLLGAAGNGRPDDAVVRAVPGNVRRPSPGRYFTRGDALGRPRTRSAAGVVVRTRQLQLHVVLPLWLEPLLHRLPNG